MTESSWPIRRMRSSTRVDVASPARQRPICHLLDRARAPTLRRPDNKRQHRVLPRHALPPAQSKGGRCPPMQCEPGCVQADCHQMILISAFSPGPIGKSALLPLHVGRPRLTTDWTGLVLTPSSASSGAVTGIRALTTLTLRTIAEAGSQICVPPCWASSHLIPGWTRRTRLNRCIR